MTLEKATLADASDIWEILQFAIESRRLDGSQQWQDGYPNLATVKSDIEDGYGYLLRENGQVLCYCALLFNNEPAYNNIVGKWLSHGDFLVVHRVAVSAQAKGKGVAQELFVALEGFAKQNNVYSIKVDTNFDNGAMLYILEKLNYTYCGEVFFRGAARKAFEKVLA